MGSGPSTNSYAVDDEADNRLDTQREVGDGESDEAVVKGQRLAILVIQEVAFHKKSPPSERDIILETLCSCVTDILQKHVLLLNGMVNRVEVNYYHEFAWISNELFEGNANNESSQLKITWGRIVALFAFAVRLSQEYRQDQLRVHSITRFLVLYVTKNVIPFVKENGGWHGLVEQFPSPDEGDAQLRKAILWSGLCVGLVATMYISSLLR